MASAKALRQEEYASKTEKTMWLEHKAQEGKQHEMRLTWKRQGPDHTVHYR